MKSTRLENAINCFTHELMQIKESEGIETTLALVIASSDGEIVTAARNGILEDVPFRVAMTAADVGDKGRDFGVAMASRQRHG